MKVVPRVVAFLRTVSESLNGFHKRGKYSKMRNESTEGLLANAKSTPGVGLSYNAIATGHARLVP
jgi:hypothetical protein